MTKDIGSQVERGRFVTKSSAKVLEARQINAEQETEVKLHEIQKRLALLNPLIAGVCHDFNNILGITSGNLDLIRLKNENDLLKKYLENIQEATRRGAELTRMLLNTTSLKSPKTTICDVNASIEKVLTNFEATVSDLVEIEFKSFGEAYCCASQFELEDSLANVISNAINAIDRSGKIGVECRIVDRFNLHDCNSIAAAPKYAQRYVVVKVADNGCGIPAVDYSNIFSPYFKNERNTGSGLGLSTVLGFVVRHEFGLTLKSAIGAGSIFNLWMPLVEKPRSKETEQ